jgi:hypothetical protein
LNALLIPFFENTVYSLLEVHSLTKESTFPECVDCKVDLFSLVLGEQ